MSPKREHLCFFTLFQFATYRSETASSIAFENLYTFSNRRSVPFGNTSAFLRYFNLLLIGAKLQTVSLLQASTLSPIAEVSPSGTPLLTLHYFNLLHTGASCSLASPKYNFSASLRNHILVCLLSHHAFRQEKKQLQAFLLITAIYILLNFQMHFVSNFIFLL